MVSTIKMMGMAVVAVAALGMSSNLRAEEAAKPATATVANAKTVTFKVEGMTCAGCAKSVAGKYKKTEGVVDAAADNAAGTATVTFDPAKTTEEKLLAALAGTDFKASKPQ